MSEKQVRVRFAPSPTGKLHIGGARTAIYNWAFARANGGKFILRIDDTDPTRSTEENTQIILRAMKWLGLDWDEGPDKGGDCGPYSQTERLNLYREAANKLLAEGKAYPCFCTPEKLAEDKKAAEERHDPFQGYQRTCRNIDPAEAQRRIDAGEPYTIRIKVPLDRGDVIVHDAVHGDVTFNARELDDFIIFRSDGTPTYNFATVVDDAGMGITHIIRGDDHLSNTPRQIMVYEALGAPVPTFAHISMILGPDGKKLSKRHGATSVEEYRDQGYLADAFVNYLALLGWSLDGETTIVPRDVLASQFSLDHVSKNPAKSDPERLNWINATYLANMDNQTFAKTVLIPELVGAGLEPVQDSATDADEIYATRPNWYDLLSEILRPRTTVSPDVIEKSRFLYEGANVTFDQKSVEKGLTKDAAQSVTVLRNAKTALKSVPEDQWKAAAIDTALEVLPEQLDLKKRIVFQSIRVAECGNMVSPPLGESMELLGREVCLARLDRALELCK